jgi:hypothetical protein
MPHGSPSVRPSAVYSQLRATISATDGRCIRPVSHADLMLFEGFIHPVSVGGDIPQRAVDGWRWCTWEARWAGTGINHPTDVRLIQQLLNRFRPLPLPLIKVDGKIDLHAFAACSAPRDHRRCAKASGRC